MIGVLVVTAGWWYVTEGVGRAIAVVGVPGAVGGAAARQRLRRTGWSGRRPGWVELECQHGGGMWETCRSGRLG